MAGPLIPTDTITRVRRAAGTTTGGRYTAGAETTSSIAASVQYLSGIELQTLPEGERSFDWRRLTVAPGTLRAPSQHDGSEGDLVEIDAIRYQVRHVDNARFLIPHQRVYVVREREAS